MTRDYAARPYSEVRRNDRAVEDAAWIAAMLHSAPFGTLATMFEGQPFINSNLFAFDEAAHVIYMHTAPAGRTRSNVERDARCCFSVSEMGRLLPSVEALNMSVEYAGVTAFGRAVLVEDAGEKEHALRLLLEKYFPHLRPGADFRPPSPDELARTSIYRIEIEQWSGKKKEVEPDFPGAFRYGTDARET
jgi:hypothetical protein